MSLNYPSYLSQIWKHYPLHLMERKAKLANNNKKQQQEQQQQF